MSDYLTMDGTEHPWDKIRSCATALGPEAQRMAAGAPMHESLLRSWHIVDQVKVMLDRGDSAATVREFVAWAEARYIGKYDG